MRSKLRLEPSVSTKLDLRAMLIKIAIGGVALSIVIFFGVFTFNYLGIQTNSEARNSEYPLDLSSPYLTKVNFMVLSPEINTSYEEVRPMISGNGNALFFCRRKHPENIMRKKDPQDIWVSYQNDGQWTAPENLGPTINSVKGDAICSVNPDGSEIIFMHEEMAQEQPLMKAKRTDQGWSEPQPMEIEDFYNKSQYVDFYYSYEANVLLMALQRRESRGEQDLYVSFPIENNKWSEPVNLGPVVNSFDADFAPFLSADTRTLYFVSNGHKGFGGCDIFQSTRLDDTWQRWSKPLNLGEGINSEREESYFSISKDHKHIYFESYSDKMKIRDIFRADIPADVKPKY